MLLNTIANSDIMKRYKYKKNDWAISEVLTSVTNGMLPVSNLDHLSSPLSVCDLNQSVQSLPKYQIFQGHY